MFENFLTMVLAENHEFYALGALREYSRPGGGMPTATIVPQFLEGREGWVATQRAS